MQIDFNSLSFKIEKPDLNTDNQLNNNISLSKIKVKQYLGFEDTQASGYQQETTTNPFRRTFHLFKHVQMEKRNSEEKSYRGGDKSPAFNKINNTLEANQTTFSLSNFDSFKNMESKGDTLQSITKHLFDSKPTQQKNGEKQSNSNQFIKIESSYQYQNSEEFSLIMDDLNCQLRCDDLIPEPNRRIKTQYIEEEPKNKKKDKKNNSGIFCLTMQEQSSAQSHVQEFYFDLRKEKQKIQEQEKQVSLKKEIKSIIYDFVDDLEIMEESQIDPEFIKKIQQCLISVKKIPGLPISKPEATPEKWNLSNRKSLTCNSRSQSFKNIQVNQLKRFDKGQPSQKPIINHSNLKNKQNATPFKNSFQQTRKKAVEKNIYKVMQSKLHKEQKKKKWIL